MAYPARPYTTGFGNPAPPPEGAAADGFARGALEVDLAGAGSLTSSTCCGAAEEGGAGNAEPDVGCGYAGAGAGKGCG